MSTGDLHFYRSSGSLVDQLIVAGSGPFVHVDVELADGSCIGELSSGLHRYVGPAPMSSSIVVYTTYQHVADPLTLAQALNWAIEQLSPTALGNPPLYGWADIVDAAVYHFDPAFPFLVAQPGRWDCSDFVVRVLLKAGVALPDAIAQEPHTVTPSSLAAALGVK